MDEFLRVLEDSFSHDEVWPEPYDHLYVSLRSGRSVGKDADVDVDSEPALQFDTEPAVEPEELEPVPTNEALAEDSHEPTAGLADAGKESRDMSTDTDDLPEMDMDRPLRVTFDKGIRCTPTLTELNRCRHHRDGPLQPVSPPRLARTRHTPRVLRVHTVKYTDIINARI